jgi:uncharacterized protein YqeY
MADALLKQTLQQDLTTALKSRRQVDVAAIRMALAAITTAEVAGKQAKTLTDEDVIAVLVREVKRRDEGAAAFRAGGREESALEEEAQADVLRRYLPQPLTDEELQELVASAVATATAEGLSGGRAMGRVMGLLKEPTAGRVEGAALAAQVKAALGLGK